MPCLSPEGFNMLKERKMFTLKNREINIPPSVLVQATKGYQRLWCKCFLGTSDPWSGCRWAGNEVWAHLRGDLVPVGRVWLRGGRKDRWTAELGGPRPLRLGTFRIKLTRSFYISKFISICVIFTIYFFTFFFFVNDMFHRSEIYGCTVCGRDLVS